MTWDPVALPRQEGKTFVVTGATAGIGYFVAEQLASTGARVVIAARSPQRIQRAFDAIRTEVPDALLDSVPLDLASLASVADAAAAIRALGPIDGLINNAGLVNAPGNSVRDRMTTADGHEMVVGANFLGHFALTAQVFPALAPQGRVIGLGSDSTKMVRLDADDLWSERRYRAFRAYAFSKHAVQGFIVELDRRLRAAADARMALLAHPGYANGSLSAKRAGITDDLPRADRLVGAIIPFLAQGKDRGAWPVVRAALDPSAQSGEYYGPSGLLAGKPVLVKPVASSAAPDFGARLWADAEEKSGAEFRIAHSSEG